MTTSPRTLLVTGLLRQQVILHLPARLGARIWILMSPMGWADSTGLRALLCACMAYDLLLAYLLRRHYLSDGGWT